MVISFGGGNNMQIVGNSTIIIKVGGKVHINEYL